MEDEDSSNVATPNVGEIAKFVNNQKGHLQFAANSGFLYHFKKKYPTGRELWWCKEWRSSFLKCKATAVIQNH